MKILRIKYENIELFKEGLCIDFSAIDKVNDKSYVSLIQNSIYTQKVLGVVGINASGKSTALRLIRLAMDIVLGDEGIVQRRIPTGIIRDDSRLSVDFYYDDNFYRLESIFNEKVINDNNEFVIGFKNERIYKKSKSKVKSKKDIYVYHDEDIIHRREKFEEQIFSMLKPEDSIIHIITKNVNKPYTEMIRETNINIYRVNGKAETEFINLFDESIESIQNNDDNIEICFKENDSSYQCKKSLGSEFLSSGTIKGGNLLYLANYVLKTGGYLLVDEIENHMHKELVLAILDFFIDENTNRYGATIIFSTHYAELLDSFERKDNIYITRKKENYSCEMVRYSDEVKRNDIKKSEIFLSNFIEGTAPSYESIERVRKYLCQD
jgi:predicted ATPase